MTESIRNLPRYIRQTDAFGWQGADTANGPWRSIPPPQSGTPWQTTNPMDDLRQASAAVSGVAVLSPAAQAVMDVAVAVNDLVCTDSIAAALRAAADAITPAPLGLKTGASPALKAVHWERKTTREQILAIAAELEGQ
jgi:hypothetical protein